MIQLAQLNPLRFARVFRCKVRIAIQIKGPGSVFFNHSQGEAAIAGAGLELTQANTSGTMQPWTEEWQGELWFVGSVASVPFDLVILSEEGVI